MLKSSLCDYSDAYILLRETMTAPNTGTIANINNRKNCPPCTDCTSKIDKEEIHNAKEIDIVMSMYNLIEYTDNYSKTYWGLCQYYRDENFLDNNGAIVDFPADNNNSTLFRFKTKIADKTGNYGTQNVKILKYFNVKVFKYFLGTLEMPLINCKIYGAPEENILLLKYKCDFLWNMHRLNWILKLIL